MSVQLISGEGKNRKRFTANRKLEILREWEAGGNGVEVAQRNGIHPMTLYRWKRRLEEGAAEFLKGSRPRTNPRIRDLEKENRNLKETVTLLSQELMLLKKRMNLV
jgi:transposase-like protein